MSMVLLFLFSVFGLLLGGAGLVAFLDRGRGAAFGGDGLLLGFIQVFVRAFLAQVKFFKLVVGQYFRYVQGGRFGTLLTLHCCGSPVMIATGVLPCAILTA